MREFILSEKQKKALKTFEHIYLIREENCTLMKITKAESKLTKDNFKAIYYDGDNWIELTVEDFEYYNVKDDDYDFIYYDGYLDRESIPEEVKELLDTEIRKRNSK